MAGRLAHPQYSKRRVGEPLRAYARRVNAKYDDDWAMKARERRAQHAARLPTPEDQDDAIRRSVESNAARWKLDDDDVWLVRARLAHGGPRRPRSPPQPRQRPRRALNIEYPEAQSLSDYESDSGSESGHLLPDCDSDSNDDGHELCAAPVLAFFPRRRVRPSPQVAAEPLRTKRRREDEDDIITNDIKRCKTDPAVGQTEPIKTSSKRRRDDDGDYNCDEKETMRSSKRQRVRQDPPSPPTDTEPALAAIPSPTSDGFSQKATASAENTKRVRERPDRSTAGLPHADVPAQGQKRTSRSSVPVTGARSATDKVMPQGLLEGPRMTRRSGTAQLYQLNDRGQPTLQRIATRVPQS